jgi:hypothetical protein
MISQSVWPISLPFASRTVYDSFPKASRHFAGSETMPSASRNPHVHEVVVCWVAAFFARSCSYGAVVNYLKGWNCFSRQQGWDVGIWQRWQFLPRVLRGIKRHNGVAALPKLPITPDLLLQFVVLLSPTGPSLALGLSFL